MIIIATIVMKDSHHSRDSRHSHDSYDTRFMIVMIVTIVMIVVIVMIYDSHDLEVHTNAASERRRISDGDGFNVRGGCCVSIFTSDGHYVGCHWCTGGHVWISQELAALTMVRN